MKKIVSGLLAGLFVLFSSGCSMTAPNYLASIDNIEALKKAGNFHAKIGEFTSRAGPENINPLSLRGNSMASPYQNSYSAYIAEALKQELELAGKLTPDADIELSGMLIKNNIDPAIGIGRSNIAVQVIVKKNGKINYDQIKSTGQQWESSFVGAVAIPLAVQKYMLTVQDLLAKLYADGDFINALK